MSTGPASSQIQDATAVSRSAVTSRRTGGTAPAFAFGAPSAEDEIRLHLSDIPRLPTTLDIEGFRPSLLSRLFDLVAPIKPDRR